MVELVPNEDGFMVSLEEGGGIISHRGSHWIFGVLKLLAGNGYKADFVEIELEGGELIAVPVEMLLDTLSKLK